MWMDIDRGISSFMETSQNSFINVIDIYLSVLVFPAPWAMQETNIEQRGYGRGRQHRALEDIGSQPPERCGILTVNHSSHHLRALGYV